MISTTVCERSCTETEKKMTGRLVNFSALSIIVISATIVHGRAPQKILDGSTAQPGELKYQVSLQRRNYNQCGGALISELHVLTAAHCFVGRDEPPYTKGLVVVTGSTKHNRSGEHHRAKYVTVHPDYVKGNSANRWRHDIAVITFATPAVTTSFQAPLALPTSDVTISVPAIVGGWGQMQRGWNGTYPTDLQKLNVTILTQAECNERNRILDTQLCAFSGADTGFCHGDSGSPLVYNNTVVGVVSNSVSCGIGYPDIYTRVWSYIDFIKDAMKRQ